MSAPGATLVLHLAAAQIDAIVPQLLAGGYRAETPCAVVAFASWPQEQVVRCTLADLAAEMHAANITRTAVIVVGDVLTAEGFADSYLYSSGRARAGARTDAGAAARRHLGGQGARRATASRRRRDQFAGRAGARSGAAGRRGAHRRVRRCRRDATAGCSNRRSTPSSTPPIPTPRRSPPTPPQVCGALGLPHLVVARPGMAAAAAPSRRPPIPKPSKRCGTTVSSGCS